jgi:hypothetical protein
LRARVPVRHRAGGVEHVDRVVRDALDEQPESLVFLDLMVAQNACLAHRVAPAHDDRI